MMLYLRIRPRSNESKEIDPVGDGEIFRNHATIPGFFACVIESSIGFERVVVLAIGLVRKVAAEDSWLRIFGILFHIRYGFRRTHSHTEKWLDL